MMHAVINPINNILDFQLFANTVRDMIIALIIFGMMFLGLNFAKRIAVTYLGKLAKRTVSDFDDFIIGLISQVGWPVISMVSIYVAANFLTLSASIKTAIRDALIFVVTIRSILLLQAIIEYGINKTLLQRMGKDNPSSKAFIKSLLWVLKWAVWVLGGVFILDNLGVNISSLVAGIGIGGIAVAMASQAVLGDAFSALSIYLDKPFEIGDFIIIDDNMGTVEHIGVKTTRIRSLSGEQLVFANSDLTKSRVKNYKRMETRRVVFKVGVVYKTPLSLLEKVPEMIKGILQEAGVRLDRVHLQGFGDSALVFEIVYYVMDADYNVYMDKQQAMNFAIIREFERFGIQFAYPTQTLYIHKDNALEAVS